MKKKRLYKNRAKSLIKGKIHSLNLIEKLSMKFAGLTDGKKGLIKQTKAGTWWSTTLQMLVDSYEEYCDKLYGNLKYEDEEEFKNVSILCNQIEPKNKKYTQELNLLKETLKTVPDVSTRKAGEEKMTNEQVATRRTRERSLYIINHQKSVDAAEADLRLAVDQLLTCISTIKEDFNTTCRISNRILNHCQRKADIYWREVMKHIPELPPSPEISFKSESREAYNNHYLQVVSKAEEVISSLSINV